MNQYIRHSPVRVIDEEGKNLGVIETATALRTAQERGLDLIEIAPNAPVPVCRIMDFGKFKYDREKGERERNKRQVEAEVKRIRIGFTTGAHDLDLRARQIENFMERGAKIRIEMRLRGREKALGAVALQKFSTFLGLIRIPHQMEFPPKRTPQGIQTTIFKALIKHHGEKSSTQTHQNHENGSRSAPAGGPGPLQREVLPREPDQTQTDGRIL
ncbi:MAG: translation initiation factor IF-3 [Patescibacteria group bacterium]